MSMKNIKHVVYYMLENRSFDNLLGWLYSEENPPAHIIANPTQKNQPYHGLQENTYYNQFKGDDTKHYVQKGTETMRVPDPDPKEAFVDVNQGIFGQQANPPTNTPASMSGFLQNYSTARKLFGVGMPITKQEALQILETYTPEQVPVISGLAEHYAVSDQWFSSVPAQTNCNRAFSTCGTSMGLVNNAGALNGLIPSKFKTRNIWQVLSENGFDSTDDWMIYYQGLDYNLYSYTHDAFEIPNGEENIANIDKFFDAAAKGELPAFSYLEPDWLGLIENGNSYHPDADLIPGEQFLKKLFDAMTATEAAKEAWQNTLLIITFDEHGGTYDHVPPPWGAFPPWGKNRQPPPGITLECDFDFDRFGVRVPTILASPWVESGTVFRSLTDVPYDSTSMIATLLEWKGIPREQWNLGERVANAPSFANVLTRKTPRKDAPIIDLTSYVAEVPDPKNSTIHDLHRLVTPLLFKKISAGRLSAEDAVSKADELLKNAHNLAEFRTGVSDFIDQYGATK